MPKGTTEWMQATGIFSDASSQMLVRDVIWHSSNPLVAVIDNGGACHGNRSGRIRHQRCVQGHPYDDSVNGDFPEIIKIRALF